MSSLCGIVITCDQGSWPTQSSEQLGHGWGGKAVVAGAQHSSLLQSVVHIPLLGQNLVSTAQAV